METFACWHGLLEYLRDHAYVYYQAPLDLHPVPVVVTKRYKNGKLRINYHDCNFTADQSHLDRFRWRNTDEDSRPRICGALRGLESWSPSCDLIESHTGSHRWQGPSTDEKIRAIEASEAAKVPS